MKNLKPLLLATYLYFLSATVAKAQDVLFADKQIKGLSTIFNTKTTSKDSFLVADVENELAGKKLHIYDATKFKKRPAYSMYPTMTSVFSKERLQYLIGERALIANYYVSGDGKIQEVTFSLRKGTTLTADEVEKLQYAMIREFSFTLSPKTINNQQLVILRDSIPYRRIIDHTYSN